ncbi:DUF6473 family protein [Tropicimonas sp. TH_r6]|uniref:DUF6473 family protein n=1 Tax=Tropicimonas sp. TH_r6 TaxID=3082085 RepID=UPI002952F67F|nr:DUF6473 family protein [Tropicimonas sp. TH_r6]MDV7142414.1 DUF6473 family protein [Tropicimonas sp. TH_r6]
MAFEHPGNGALDYLPCRYGESKLLFRGPKKRLDVPYVAFFGSTETYGRFIETPFPDLVGTSLGLTSVNLGCVNGGIDVYNKDQTLLDIAAEAKVTVLQVMGAHNLSNRFYSVHPRRNDRFVGPSALMQTVYREVDFTDFAFTRHLMTNLRAQCRQRFEMVTNELKAAWTARMHSLLEKIKGPKVLLWLADHTPEEARIDQADYTQDPLYINREMLDDLRSSIDGYVEVVYDPAIRATRTEGMVFSELEAPAAMETPGMSVHQAASTALSEELAKFL